jgi:hypothetical protein
MNTCTLSTPEPFVVPIQVLLRDLDVLRGVCRQRGWEFLPGATMVRCAAPPASRHVAPGRIRCDHAIIVPGCRGEIGLVLQGDHYQTAWDPAAEGGLEATLGRGLHRLWCGYLVEKVRRTVKPGHLVGSPTMVQGMLRLRIEGSPDERPLDRRSAGVDGRRIAHVCWYYGSASIWCLGEGAWPTFRYLADALGTVS